MVDEPEKQFFTDFYLHFYNLDLVIIKALNDILIYYLAIY